MSGMQMLTIATIQKQTVLSIRDSRHRNISYKTKQGNNHPVLRQQPI